ncbi:hypothetical protein [Roseibium sp.]|uniref:portal protein n=1 Tax=Roseibium sp. TaxID=1936156 RepID=UPI00328044CF
MTEATKITKGEPVPQSFKRWYLNDRDKTEDWRKEAREDYDFFAGRQYTDEEMAALKDKARPIVTFNRIGPVVDSVHGQEIGNRREVRYIPREEGDVKPNEILTSAAEWFRDQSHADDEESDSFLDTIICGMGWTETRIDFEEQPDGKPVVSRVDPLEMFWDFDARSRNLSDARRVWRVRRVPLSEAMSMFPGKPKAELDATWTMVQSAADLQREEDTPNEDEDAGDGMVTIVHCQWVERESYMMAQDPLSGEVAEFTEAEFSTVNKRLKQMVGVEMQGVRKKRKVRKQAFMGDVVLSNGPAPCPYQFSFQCITGKRDRNKGTWYGLVRAMKDPQRWANKWLSQMMHIMNSNSKGGLLAERGAFDDQRQAEASWADPSAITWLKSGALSGQAPAVKEKGATQFPAGFQQLTEFAISSIRDTSGVSVEMLGMREANQAASLEYQRRQAGMTILQPLFDSLKHYRELQGRVMLHYIQEDLSDGRLIRIVGEAQSQYVPLVKQSTLDYDIIVEDAPTSPNQKEATWGFLSQLLPSIAKMVPPQMLLMLMEYSPLPSAVIEKLQKAAQEMEQQQQPAQQAQQQMAMEQHQSEMAKAASETAENQAGAQLDVAKAQAEDVYASAEFAQAIQALMNPQVPEPSGSSWQ